MESGAIDPTHAETDQSSPGDDVNQAPIDPQCDSFSTDFHTAVAPVSATMSPAEIQQTVQRLQRLKQSAPDGARPLVATLLDLAGTAAADPAQRDKLVSAEFVATTDNLEQFVDKLCT